MLAYGTIIIMTSMFVNLLGHVFQASDVACLEGEDLARCVLPVDLVRPQ